MNTEDKNKLDDQGRRHGTWTSSANSLFYRPMERDYDHGNLMEERYYKNSYNKQKVLDIIKIYPLSPNLNLCKCKFLYTDRYHIYCVDTRSIEGGILINFIEGETLKVKV